MTTNLYYSIWFIKPVSKKDAVDYNICVRGGLKLRLKDGKLKDRREKETNSL